MRGGQSKKSDEAGKAIGEMSGKGVSFCQDSSNESQDFDANARFSLTGQGNTVSGTSVNAKDQVANQSSGSANHLELGK